MIKVGESTLNQQRITIGMTEIGRVYIGSSLVWVKPIIRTTAWRPVDPYCIQDSGDRIMYQLQDMENSVLLTTYALASDAAYRFYVGTQRSVTRSITAAATSWEIGNIVYNDYTGIAVIPDGYYIYLGANINDMPIIYRVESGIITLAEQQIY